MDSATKMSKVCAFILAHEFGSVASYDRQQERKT
jgi:hypothetical protein